ncbi:hypothetical protein ACLQ3H_16775 [Micromonospora saelicesensis]|uniref:hypothetical protein n=1 Tax=Micromonospora saelicesensis TaxID=285676 RepID=UPI003CF448E6
MGVEQPNSGKVETGGGAYIAGNVQTSGGEFVGRDSIKPFVRGSVGNLSAGTVQGDVKQEGSSLGEFQQALREFADQVQSAHLSASFKNAIIADAEIVKSESEAPQPDRDLILHKVNSISQLIERTSVTTGSLTELGQFAHRLAEWAGNLFG